METAVKNLARSFAGVRALDITEDRLANYEARRREQQAAPASVKYEFSILRKGFNLAVARKIVPRAPKMPSVEVDNARQGFFEAEDLERVMVELPNHVRPIIRFAALTGWRIRAEVMALTWDRVDWQAGVVRLEVRSTKNRDGRTFPFSVEPRLEALLKAQRQYTDVVETMEARAVPWVFHRSGKRIRDFYGSWHAACERAKVAGPGGEAKIPHDLRRTAVRNLERAGVSRSVATKLTGHKTEAVYLRYAIVNEADLREGVTKLARSFTEHAQSRSDDSTR
jgi:integrase